ncbi:MAG: hypothetical protein ACU84H_17055 [Gammaproteobacteria bacterium]
MKKLYRFILMPLALFSLVFLAACASGPPSTGGVGINADSSGVNVALKF